MTELKLQAACYKEFNHTFQNHRKHLYRIKNELDNHPRKSQKDRILQLAENKATGIQRGIADFVLIDNFGQSHWIELKIENGTQSIEQQYFEKIVKNYKIVKSISEFIKHCESILIANEVLK